MSVRPRLAPHDIDHAVAMDVVPGTRVAARVRYALRAAATGRRPLRDAATRELNASESHYDDPARTENAVAIVAAGGAGIAGFVIPTVRWWRRRPGRRAGVAPVVREPGPEAAQEASEALQRVAATIAAAEHPADEAFDLYSAASKAQQEARTPVDSVGVLVLAHDAAAVLAGGPRPRRCFFDPSHPGETTPTRWRLGREEAEVPACPRCVRALHAGRAPDALGDRGRPYYERDTVWARTGFGAIDDELAAKVLAGR
jgi:hypothetical protein